MNPVDPRPETTPSGQMGSTPLQSGEGVLASCCGGLDQVSGSPPASPDGLPVLLILTAGFGEGHNSAAKGLAEAAIAGGKFFPVIHDATLEGQPRFTRFLQKSYRFCIRSLPGLWHAIYESTDRINLNHCPSFLTRGASDNLEMTIARLKPAAIVSTYPIYPYWLKRIFRGHPSPPHQSIVVTDSITINSTWVRSSAERWFVTDPHTRSTLLGQGVPASRVSVTGFPVRDAFCPGNTPDPSGGEKVDWTPGSPFRILYFATQRKPLVKRTIRALLSANPDVHITIILGRHTPAMFARARKLCREHVNRTTIIGWSDAIARLMRSHHLAVGKAGGATVHEAIASRCPMLINHLVPGQEEGNTILLQKMGGGFHAEDAFDLQLAIRSLLADNGQQWREMKRRLGQLPAICAAARILEEIPVSERVSGNPEFIHDR